MRTAIDAWMEVRLEDGTLRVPATRADSRIRTLAYRPCSRS